MNENGSHVTWAGLLKVVIPLIALTLSLAAVGERRLNAYSERLATVEAHYVHIQQSLARIERLLEKE